MSTDTLSPDATLAPREFEHALGAHRHFLVRLARSQLDAASAEDAVQETMLAAWRGYERFNGESSLRTWMVAILRFKIIDQIRSHRGIGAVVDSPAEAAEMAEGDGAFDGLFDAHGRWTEQPAEWQPDASESVAQQQMMTLLQVCLDNLPANTSRVFLMREYLGFDTGEICAQAGLNAGNVRILLYRARMRLRTCLDLKINA
jgi:RNA polymerase sigma-70 factor (ECF subfamily)